MPSHTTKERAKRGAPSRPKGAKLSTLLTRAEKRGPVSVGHGTAGFRGPAGPGAGTRPAPVGTTAETTPVASTSFFRSNVGAQTPTPFVVGGGGSRLGRRRRGLLSITPSKGPSKIPPRKKKGS